MSRLPVLDVPQRLTTYPIVYPGEASLSWQISHRSGFCFALLSIVEQGLHFYFPSALTIHFGRVFYFSPFQFSDQLVTAVLRGN